MLRRTFVALIAAAALSTQVHAQEAKPLNFGIISTESSTNLKSVWQPVIDDLSRAIGVPVKPFFASDYAGIIEGMRFNKVQMAWYGNKAAIEAVDRANGEVFASVIDKDGNPGYWSLLIVNKDSDIKSLDDLLKRRGQLTYGAGDPNSTSGTAVPGYYLWAANKIEPKTFFKAVRVSNHETNLLSVINKQVDVAVNNTEALERYRLSTGKDANDSVRILWKSPLIPADPLVMRTDLPADMKARIRDFFVNYGKGKDAAREMANLKALTYQGFRASDNQQLVPIRQIELAREKAKIEADATIGQAEKQKQLADLDAKLASLRNCHDPGRAFVPVPRRPALVVAGPARMGLCAGAAGHVVAWRRHAAAGPVAGLGQHGPVRGRLLPAQFPRLAHVPGRDDRDGADRGVGHVPGDRGGRAAGAAVLVEHGAGLGLPADAAPDGRLPRHQ